VSDNRAEEFVALTESEGALKDDEGRVIDQEKWSQRVLFKMYINYVVGNDKIPSWHDFLSFEEEMRSL
jgi:hypothetical protein